MNVKRNFVFKDSKQFPWGPWQAHQDNRFSCRWQTGIHATHSKHNCFNVIIKNNTTMKLNTTFVVVTDTAQPYHNNSKNVQYTHNFEPGEELMVNLEGNPRSLDITAVYQVFN